MADLKYALRLFMRTPGFTVVAIATLALGIGASTAIFTVVNAVLLRPLPYPHPDDIVQVWSTSPSEPKGALAAADFIEFQKRNHTLSALAGYREDAFNVATAGAEPVRLAGAQVTIDYFDVFATPAVLGRTFSRAADASTAEPLIILSEKAWTRQLHANPAVAGTRIAVNGVAHTIVGVMPGSFAYPGNAEAWVLSSKAVPLPPLDISGDLLESRDVHYFKAVGRVRPGTTPEQAERDLGAIAADLGRRFPQTNSARGAAAPPLREEIVGDVRGALLMLLAAVGLVLLIACANVASLLLARASGRSRELAIRAALGANRTRLVRQLITESLLLGAAGGVAGLIAGSWAVALLLRIVPDGIPRIEQVGLDLRVAMIAIAASLGSAVLFGLAPALQASRAQDALALRDADRAATAGTNRARSRAVFVVGEIALTLILLVSAGLLGNSFSRLRNVNPGFQPEHVTMISIPLPQAKYTDGSRQTAFYTRLLEHVEQHPEVTAAAILFPSPIDGRNANGTFTVEGSQHGNEADQPFAAIASVSGGYFGTMGIPLIQGRTFADQDRDPAPAVAIVNAELARRYLGGASPIGRRIRFGDTGDDWITIVGVAGNSTNLGLAEPPSPSVYIPYHSFPLPFMRLAARSNAAPGAIASLLRSEVRNADPDLPVEEVVALKDMLRESIAEPRFRALVLSVFAVIAVVLAIVGVYGLISYTVTQRTREIGIRIALGAQGAHVILPMLREGASLALAGVTIGVVGAFAASHLLARFLFGVTPTDPLTYAAVSVLMFGLALLASYIPARRALRLDPLSALRND